MSFYDLNVEVLVADLSQNAAYTWVNSYLPTVKGQQYIGDMAQLWSKALHGDTPLAIKQNLGAGLIYEQALVFNRTAAPDPQILQDYIFQREGVDSLTYRNFAPITATSQQASIMSNDPTLASFLTAQFLLNANYDPIRDYIKKWVKGATAYNYTQFTAFQTFYAAHPPSNMMPLSGGQLKLAPNAMNPLTGQPMNSSGGGGGGSNGSGSKTGSNLPLFLGMAGVGAVVYYYAIK